MNAMNAMNAMQAGCAAGILILSVCFVDNHSKQMYLQIQK